MNVGIGLISQACPGWGLEENTITSLVAQDAGGHPDVLAGQMICGAAMAGMRVLMLLPGPRDKDEVWAMLVTLLGDGDAKAAGKTLCRLPIVVCAMKTGRDRIGQADLVYAPGLSARELRDLETQTTAPILVTGPGVDDSSDGRSSQVIRVGSDTLLIEGGGFEVPVVYDPSGPMYRAA